LEFARQGTRLKDKGFHAGAAKHCKNACVSYKRTCAFIRLKRPADYLRIIASLVPKQVEIQTDPFDGISDTDLAAFVALAQS